MNAPSNPEQPWTPQPDERLASRGPVEVRALAQESMRRSLMFDLVVMGLFSGFLFLKMLGL